MKNNLLKPFYILLLIVILPCMIFAQSNNNENNQSLSFKMKLSNSSCQFSIWIEKISGSFLNTVCVTYKTAQRDLGNKRLNVLPVWAYRQNIDYGNGKIYPTLENPLPDAITTASPPRGEFVWNWEPSEFLESGDYYFFVEINKSYDYNNTYIDPIDQPSVVWRGIISIGENNTSGVASLIGHGNKRGVDGNINTDISTLTTAINLLSDVQVEYMAPLIVNNPPKILTQSIPDAIAGELYNTKIEVNDPDINDILTFELLIAPNWLSIDQSGVLTGTPNDNDIGDDVPLILRVADQQGFSDTLKTKINVTYIIFVNNAPEKFCLYNPYPNPFNKSISFSYTIPVSCNVKLTIYDILGREITNLLDGFMNKGTHTVVWNGSGLDKNLSGSSIYLYKLDAGNYFRSGKILFLK